MIARHARRSLSAQRLNSLRPSPRQIQLQSTSLGLSRCYVATNQPHPRRRRISDANYRRVRERYLATAVGELGFPFSQLPHSTIPPFQSPPVRSYDVSSFDPAMPLKLPEPGDPALPTKVNNYGIPGTVEDLLSVFDACIRVGKLDRAMLVLKRIDTYALLSPEERIYLHNRYLRASLSQMRSLPDRKQAEQLHKWYELQIRNVLPHTAETVACMLKTSLLSERGSRLNRLVRRYMGMAPDEAGLRVLSMADILSDQDLAIITAICPTYNFEAEIEAEGLSEDSLESAQAEAEGLSPRNDAPELIPTPQQGDGLATLKKGLDFLTGIQDMDISKLSEADKQNIQLQLERDSISSAITRWRSASKNLQKLGITTAIGTSSPGELSLTQHLGSWLSAMEARLKEEIALVALSEQKTVKTETDLYRCLYGPLIAQTDPSRLAAVTILAVLNIGALVGADQAIPVSRLINHVAKLAQEDLHMQQKETAKKERRKRRVQFNPAAVADALTENSSTQPVNTASAFAETELTPKTIMEESPEMESRSEQSSSRGWSTQLRAQIGSVLLKALIESTKVRVTKEHPTSPTETVSQYQPAFTHGQQTRKGKKTGVLYINPFLVEQLKKEPTGDFLAKHLPMVVEPKPWQRMNSGGFLESKTQFMRVKPGDVEQRLYTNAAIKCGDMKQVFKGLDVLGKTPWRINQNVLNVMMEAWNSGKEIANMPPLHPDLTLPPEPDSSADPLLHRQWVRDVKAIENERSGLHSQRCYMNLQLEIARSFRKQTIYFPHNVDYRGRAYPIPTYLNHMGADHTRALLVFANGKELGARGLRWLKIHMANVYGLDKASFDEREAFVTENWDNIVDSVNNPLNGKRWWLGAEDPWQCLSTCFEIKAALEMPDPTKFVSHIPVQQDGTCNGLQHYAALGGDTWGAKQVNLEPGERPADVYSAVADLVKAAITKDAAEDLPFGKILDGKITRKVVKQTVMTNVYGVTFTGAKKQVCKQIDALYPNLGAENGTQNIALASYIAKHIFTALATMFRGAHDIQYWLGDVGGQVCRALTPAQLNQIAEKYTNKSGIRKTRAKSKSSRQGGLEDLIAQFRSTIVWTTPLRMPVAQPYRKSTMKEIRTCFQTLVFPVNDVTDPVNRRKQLQGFPPNFIHSLDASHMLLSALQCHDAGLSFAAVHDSFWTHAADVDKMNAVLREAFIQIHEEDVVGRLAAEFKARHHGSLYLAHIDPNTPVAKKIKELRQNSKLSYTEELLLEHKRNTLRLSGNPWDLEAAKQIITPAAVYEDMAAAEEDVEIKKDVEAIGLGKIEEDDGSASPTKSVSGEAGMDLTAQPEADAAVVMGDTEAVSSEKTAAASKPSAKSTPLAFWLPVSIPDVPKKGDFDVTRLRESKYFFS